MGVLRIDGGFLKGRYIRFPDSKELRPLTSYIKKAIFDILGDIKGFFVADVFCGSGIFGIEAISRGAEKVAFVEKSKILCSSIHQNLINLGIQDRGEIFCIESEYFFRRNNKVFDVVFVDPPFSQNLREELIKSLKNSFKTLIIRRHKSTMSNDVDIMNNVLRKKPETRTYSDSVIYFFFSS